MVKSSKNHGNNKSMWCFCFERFCFHKFSWKLLTFSHREQSQYELEMNVYCISWLRQISEFDCCSCPSNISFKFINCCSPLVWIFLHKSYKIQGDCQIFFIFKKLFIFIKLKFWMIPFFMVLLDKQLAKHIWILIRWDPASLMGDNRPSIWQLSWKTLIKIICDLPLWNLYLCNID